MANPNMEPKHNMQPKGYLLPPNQWGGKICARSSWHITLLHQSSGQHNPPSTQCNCHQASKSNGENKSNNKTTIRLLCNAGQSSISLQSKQNDSCGTKWHRILQQQKSRTRAGEIVFLSNKNEFPPNNSAILTLTTNIKAVMSLAAEAELGALYLNSKEAAYLRQILAEMGYPQPRTPIQTNNSTAEGVCNHTVQLKQTKAMDTRFHWLSSCEAQGQFQIYWQPGKRNSTDYVTKHHSPLHHVNVRYEFLLKVKELTEARSQRLTQGQTPPTSATSRLATRVC